MNDVDVTFDCYALAEPVHSLTWYFVSANGSNTTIGCVGCGGRGQYAVEGVVSDDVYTYCMYEHMYVRMCCVWAVCCGGCGK